MSLTAMFGLLSTVAALGQAVLTVPSLNFGSVAVGTTSTVYGDYLTNNGSTSITISPLTVSAPYAISNLTTCGTTLAPGKSCRISVTFSPTALGAAPATSITVTTSAPNSPATLKLTGIGASAPTTLGASSLNFGNIQIGTTTAPYVNYLYNNEVTAITVSPLTVSAPYSISSTTCGSTLAAFSNCKIFVTFSPTAAGPAPASITVNTSASNSPLSFALSGIGVTPSTFSANALHFGNVVVGTTSPIQSVTLYNWQSSALAITSITPPAEYALSSTTCGSSVAAGSTCVISLTLTPTAVGAVPAESLSVVTNASNSPAMLPLTGAGIAQTSVSPASVNFGNVPVGTTSSLKTVTLTNNQSVNLSISGIGVTVGGPYAIDPSSICAVGTLLPGASCTIALTVSPTVVGTAPAGTLTITTNAGNSPQTVPLSATGIVPVVLSPSLTSFGNGVLGTTSAAKVLQLSNSQSSALSITGVVFNGPFVLDTGAVTTCPMSGGTLTGSLAAGTSCNIGVDFKATVVGATSGGQISVLDNAPSSPQTAVLGGTGVVAVSVSSATVPFGNVVVGATSSVVNVTIHNNQAVALNLSAISTAAPFAVVAPTSGTPCVVGTPVPVGGSCSEIGRAHV